MRMFLQCFDWFINISGIPELHFAIIPATGQVVLFVGIEVEVSNQLSMGIVDAVDLPGK